MGDITRNFSYEEFACSCGKCQWSRGYQIDLDLVKKLQKIRTKFAKSMPINSGIRCYEWNRKEGGVRKSYHLPAQSCLAADIGMTDRKDRLEIVRLALDLGLSIGCYSWGIHLDNRPAQVIF
jgi:hypothetical protein